MGPQGLRRIAVGILLLPLLAGVAQADAKKKKKHKKPKSPPVTVVSATKSTSTDGELVTVTATCPTGLLAVGGGFSNPINLVGTSLRDLHIVYESRRVGDNAWQVSGARETSAGSPPALPLTAEVDCRTARLSKPKPKKASAAKKKKKKVKRLVISEATATGAQAGTGEVSSATASCPTGTQAIGGGFSSAPPPKMNGTPEFPVYWSNLRSSPTTWSSALTSIQTSRADTTYAYCASGLKLVDATVTVPLEASSMAGIKSATAAPTCPTGKALLGGGFSATQPQSMGPLPFYSEAGPAAGAWKVTVYNLSAVPATVTSSGVCA